MHGEAELDQALHHDLGVFAPEGAAKFGTTLGESGEDEGAVGDALGAGHGDFRAHGGRERDDLDDRRQRHRAGKVISD